MYIDHGVSHDPTATPDALSTEPLIALYLVAQKSAAPAEDAERQFVARSGNLGAAYADAITARTRLLREGKFPIDGAAEIAEYLKSQDGQWSWTVKMQGASSANDFAYALGNYAWQPKEGVVHKGKYVRVWVRDATGTTPLRWTLASEVLTPDPPPKS